jgi:SAM-dependent methyltransferase
VGNGAPENPKSWHEDDEYWRTWTWVMFSPRHLAAAPEEVDRVIALLNLKPGAHILDLCCGIGRHSPELARRGFVVTGVDRTQHYLDIARQAAQKAGVTLELLRADMREFIRPDSFNAVLNLFTSFGYFEDPEDDRRVVTNMCRSLKPGGKLVIDVMGKEVLASVFRERDWREEDGTLILEERKVSNNWSRIENRWILIKDGKRHENRLSLRLYSATELETLLKSCGFGSVSIYGDFTGAPYDQNARRLVTVACK